MEENDFESKYRSWHTTMSYFKSGARLLACSIAMYFSCQQSDTGLAVLSTGLFVAELIGIAEEWV